MPNSRRSIIILLIGCSLIAYLCPVFELTTLSYRTTHFSTKGNKNLIEPNGSYLLSFNEQQLRKSSELQMAMDSKMEKPHLSKLGEWLRSPEETSPPLPNKIASLNPHRRLIILMWKYGPILERRHIRHLNSNKSDLTSPWQGCSVQNCILSYRDEDLKNADAVIFHLHRTKGIEEIPAAKPKPDQIWIFMTDESPLNTFLYRVKNKDISIYDNIFDWSMSYRLDSDVPIPYGRTVAKKNSQDNEKPKRKRIQKKRLVAILGSNCSSRNNDRWEYVKKLKRFLGEKLDIYGRCLSGNITACPGHFHKDCPVLATYKFYLAFENSNCREYITEKVFWNAYEKESVPIIMGAPRIDCQKLLPPRSYLHVDDFIAPRYLARYLNYLDDNDDAYEKYHQWRSSYTVINEHGYFRSVSKHYCRVCEALRYNSLPPTFTKYQGIGDFLNSTRDCYPYRND